MEPQRCDILTLMGADETRAAAIKERKERLGIPDVELARLAGVSRGVVHRAMRGESVMGSSLGAMEAALTRFEEETSMDVPDSEPSVTISLRDGTTVTFTGTAGQVSAMAADFLARQRRRPPDDPRLLTSR